MRFCVHLPISQVDSRGTFQNGEAVRKIAQAVEAAGFDGGYVTDHPAPSAHWLYNDPTGHDALDPFTSLAFVAAATTRLTVMTSVVVLPYRNPFLTAKAAATLQQLSDGRLILGVGVGYQKVEFDALGVPFSERGALTDEALEVMKLAWAGGPVVYEGKHFRAEGNEPRPVPAPQPPIWIGGGSDKAVERAARWGDGWAPFFERPTGDENLKASSVSSLESLKAKIVKAKQLRHESGKRTAFDIFIGATHNIASHTPSEADQYAESVRELEQVGATWIKVRLPERSLAGFCESLEWFADAVLTQFPASDRSAPSSNPIEM